MSQCPICKSGVKKLLTMSCSLEVCCNVSCTYVKKYNINDSPKTIDTVKSPGSKLQIEFSKKYSDSSGTRETQTSNNPEMQLENKFHVWVAPSNYKSGVVVVAYLILQLSVFSSLNNHVISKFRFLNHQLCQKQFDSKSLKTFSSILASLFNYISSKIPDTINDVATIVKEFILQYPVLIEKFAYTCKHIKRCEVCSLYPKRPYNGSVLHSTIPIIQIHKTMKNFNLENHFVFSALCEDCHAFNSCHEVHFYKYPKALILTFDDSFDLKTDMDESLSIPSSDLYCTVLIFESQKVCNESSRASYLWLRNQENCNAWVNFPLISDNHQLVEFSEVSPFEAATGLKLRLAILEIFPEITAFRAYRLPKITEPLPMQNSCKRRHDDITTALQSFGVKGILSSSSDEDGSSKRSRNSSITSLSDSDDLDAQQGSRTIKITFESLFR